MTHGLEVILTWSVGLVLMTKPFEHVLGLVPKGVLAGLFASHLSVKALYVG